MEGTSQDQSHNVITIEHAIVSRIFMACKEQHSWRNVLVGGFETGSRPSRKCKSMQILWVNNLCFFSIMFVPESAHGVQKHKKHTIQCPFLLLQCSFKILQVTMWAICFWQIILGLLPLHPVNAAFSLAMMLWPQVRLCYIRCWMAEANSRFQDPRFDFSSCLGYNNYSTICTGFAPDWMSLSSLVYRHCLQRTSHTYGTLPHR